MTIFSAWPFILVGGILLAFVVYCLVDLARANAVRYVPKWVWVIAIVCLHIIGGILYLLIGRDRRAPS